MRFSFPLHKKSFLTNFGVIAILGVMLASCGGSGSTGSAATSIHPGCNAGSNTQLVKLTKAHKVGWSQNALDGAWRYAEEASIEQQASQHGYQLLKTNANNSDDQQVQDIENLITARMSCLSILTPKMRKRRQCLMRVKPVSL